MSRHRRRTDAPRAPGPIFLLGDGLLLYLGLAGTVLSWTTAYGLGVSEGIDPFMTLSFMALPVIPSLRITTRGVFDVTTQSYV